MVANLENIHVQPVFRVPAQNDALRYSSGITGQNCFEVAIPLSSRTFAAMAAAAGDVAGLQSPHTQPKTRPMTATPPPDICGGLGPLREALYCFFPIFFRK